MYVRSRKWLKKQRGIHGRDFQYVADAARITMAEYVLIENGERNPSVIVAQRIADCLRFDWRMFFELLQDNVVRAEDEGDD